MTRLRLTKLLLLAALALVLAACGSDPEPVEPAAAEATGAHMGDMGGMDTDGHADTFAFGMPGDPAEADRTVEVTATDQLTFEPASIDIATGETVTFVVTKDGSTAHEFVIGDAAFQREHAEEMAAGGPMHAEANAMPLAPGQTEELTWTFNGTMDDLEFGCHVAGHYQTGMVGTLSEVA
jgi:uncharacterized cupredoxin-like copper-binding protein